MATHHWRKPLTLRMPQSKRDITITGPMDAAAVLADKWPQTYGRLYQRTLAACASEMAGRSAHARALFVEAARAIGASTSDDATPPKEPDTLPHAA
jgi:hypothetical protein